MVLHGPGRREVRQVGRLRREVALLHPQGVREGDARPGKRKITQPMQGQAVHRVLGDRHVRPVDPQVGRLRVTCAGPCDGDVQRRSRDLAHDTFCRCFHRLQLARGVLVEARNPCGVTPVDPGPCVAVPPGLHGPQRCGLRRTEGRQPALDVRTAGHDGPGDFLEDPAPCRIGGTRDDGLVHPLVDHDRASLTPWDRSTPDLVHDVGHSALTKGNHAIGEDFQDP